MVRHACALVVVAGLTVGCAAPVPIPEPVPIPQECPTLADQLDVALFDPIRPLGRQEVSARGGHNRHLWLVFLEQEQMIEYCNQRFELIRQEIERASDANRQPPQR